MDPVSSLIVVIASLFIPPLGVFFISGCSVDFIINIGLTMLGYLPGLLHALYLEYIYYSRRDDVANGVTNYDPAPGVYSDIIQRGGYSVRRFRTRESARVASPRADQYRDNVAESAPSQPQKQSPSTTYEGIRADARQEDTDAA
ncbi:hypothetical protein POJ06DRAFT_256781 [Lipomyces tetrasporus]|uniref:Stress response RCI peptide n=1 Tax=Lipomyces tetrasporus TaxID=54092 RepID=A0AAD7QQ51_9ASCO|nr:uncharacterized protein POJ06DRAFT_256781 [Lipomyces tetrasporus]KAJ8099365.1 hypothetical protein POJ06DRAFT_256781 [Lipomyces tetrasporus]